MASKKIIHNNTAGRYKSRLVKQIAKLSASA
jgi:ribosomal protein S20